MHNERIYDDDFEGDERAPEQEDSKWRALREAVLMHLLSLHPTQVTLPELTREMTRDPEDFGERDGIETAVRDLAGAGLLHAGHFIQPTRAALYFNALQQEG